MCQFVDTGGGGSKIPKFWRRHLSIAPDWYSTQKGTLHVCLQYIAGFFISGCMSPVLSKLRQEKDWGKRNTVWLLWLPAALKSSEEKEGSAVLILRQRSERSWGMPPEWCIMLGGNVGCKAKTNRARQASKLVPFNRFACSLCIQCRTPNDPSDACFTGHLMHFGNHFLLVHLCRSPLWDLAERKISWPILS